MRTCIALVAMLVSCSLALAAEKDTALVLHYAFDEGSGQVVRDQSGHGNDGEIHGAVWVRGESGTALEFNGIDDYVDCGRGSSLAITGEITVEAWVKPNNTLSTLAGTIASKYSSYRGYSMRVNSEGLPLFYITTPEQTPHANAPGYSAGQWYHLAGTWDGTRTIKIFVNGETGSAGKATALASSGTKLFIGRASHYDGGYFDGLIAEVKIYKRALTEDEIVRHYRSGATAPATDAEGE